MAKTPNVPPAPSYLTGALAEAYNNLAPRCFRAGMLVDGEENLLARYVVAEQSCTYATSQFRQAMSAGDAKAAEKWLDIQDKLVRQSLLLAGALGLTPESRRAKGIIV